MTSGSTTRDLVSVFGRRYGDHRWARALAETKAWPTGGDELARVTDRAIAQNWAMDNRVTQDREDNILTRAAFAETPGRSFWPEQRKEYHNQHIRIAELNIASGLAPDTYLDPNSTNRVPHGSPSPRAKLVRMASFSSFLRILASDRLLDANRQRRLLGEISGVDVPSLHHARGPELARLIEGTAEALAVRGEERIQEAAGLMIESFGSGQGPWWAALYHEVQADIRNDDWLAACRRLGLGHIFTGSWLLCFVYDVNTARPLFRPTSAEGNENPWHYPVPGGGGFDFGVTMSLNPGSELAPGVREFLHRPLSAAQAQAACTGKLIRLAADVVDGTEIVRLLPSFRARHRQWLLGERPATAGWFGANPEWPS